MGTCAEETANALSLSLSLSQYVSTDEYWLHCCYRERQRNTHTHTHQCYNDVAKLVHRIGQRGRERQRERENQKHTHTTLCVYFCLCVRERQSTHTVCFNSLSLFLCPIRLTTLSYRGLTGGFLCSGISVLLFL